MTNTVNIREGYAPQSPRSYEQPDMDLLLCSVIPDSMGTAARRRHACDLGVLHKDTGEIGARESLLLSESCISVALSVTISLIAGGVQGAWWKTRGQIAVGEAA